MKTQPNSYNRRSFIQFLALNSTVIAFSPQLLLTSDQLKIGFLNTFGQRKEKLSGVFTKKQGIGISTTINSSNILYVDSVLLSEIETLQEALDANLHLIINTTNINLELDLALQNLDRTKGQLLILVESTLNDKHIVFQKATMYESSDYDTTRIDEKLKILDLLDFCTKNHQFFIKNPNIGQTVILR